MSKVIPKEIITPQIVHGRKKRSGLRTFLLFVLLLVVAGAAGWEFYQRTARRDIEQAGLVMSRVKEAEQRLADREKEIVELRAEIARVKAHADVQARANQAVQRQIVALEKEKGELQSEIAMLRTLAADASATLFIKGFVLHENGNGDYRFAFTVAQVQPSDVDTKGQVTLSLSGKKGGKTVRLEGKEFFDVAQPMQLEFKNFQKVTGTIKLPQGFTPESIRVELVPENKKLKKLSEEFNWKAQRADDGKEDEKT